jgi:hypothetical protein
MNQFEFGVMIAFFLWICSDLHEIKKRQGRHFFELGCQSVLAELWNAMAELEGTRGKSSYGRGQLYILQELAKKMDLIDPAPTEDMK